MPPKNRLAILKPLKGYVTCFMCQEPVGRLQEMKNKAFCKGCETSIIVPKTGRKIRRRFPRKK